MKNIFAENECFYAGFLLSLPSQSSGSAESVTKQAYHVLISVKSTRMAVFKALAMPAIS